MKGKALQKILQNTIKMILICFGILGLVACGPIKLPLMSTFTISGLHQAKPIHSHYRTNQTLLVSMPVASPGYDSNNMVYQTVPYRLRDFAQNRWVAPPANMLLPLIAQQLRNTGYFKAIAVAPFVGVSNYRLDTQLLVLQQEFLQPVSQIVMVMQATLVNSSTNRVIASHRFQDVESAPGNNPYSGVLAANRAAAKITKGIANFVVQNLQKR